MKALVYLRLFYILYLYMLLSSVLLKTEVAVGNEKEESPAGGMPGGMGMPGMM